jgi:rifampin ADP-ribosylating transferase
VSNNVYFTTLESTAAWGAQLATALAGEPGRGHVYVVEPTGPFEDDPNVTNKRFPGNPTQSYRSPHPLVVLERLETWEGHSDDAVATMLANIARLREQGLDVIDD